ncbi:cleavage stimulation factor subunit 2 [Pyrus ussuriensis x Pyrus communis]|uniref:Cleavage stimulation factor subunit 2 n=1 Tax=Pyrus ussuriensis x Pyrus communis TaxID=2448454 RepID=A0A5N5IB79_9ROSA|nr:cleavage stimulation factor subunit 2 [Pyrus ussuriensis x Pyrus communis]
MAESDLTEASVGALLLLVVVPETMNLFFRGGLSIVAENLLVLLKLGRDDEVVKEMGNGESVKEKKMDGSATREDETRSSLETEGSH